MLVKMHENQGVFQQAEKHTTKIYVRIKPYRVILRPW